MDVFVGGVGPRTAALRDAVGRRVAAAGLPHTDVGLPSEMATIWSDGHGEALHVETPDVEVLFDGYLHGHDHPDLRDHLPVLAARIIDQGRVLDGRESGLFNVVVRDKRTGEIHLANDPGGLLPLYFGRRDGGLFFGSHQYLTAKALGAAPDLMGVLCLLSMKYALGARTYFEGVDRLCAGELVSFDPATGRLERRYPETYYRDYAEAGPGIAEELWEALLAAARPVVDDGQAVGIMLSEGFDSRLMAGVFHHLGADQRAFTHGTEGTAGTAITRTISERLGMSHEFDPLDHGFPSDLDDLRAQLALADNLHIPYWAHGARSFRAAGVDVTTTGYALDTTLGAHAFASDRGTNLRRAIRRWEEIIRQDLGRVRDEDIETVAGELLAATRDCDLDAVARRARRFLAEEPAEQVLAVLADLPGEIDAEYERLRASGAGLASQVLQRYSLENRVRRFSFGQELTLRMDNRLVVPCYEPTFLRPMSAVQPRHRLDHKLYLELLRDHLPELARIKSGAHALPATYPRVVLEASRFAWSGHEQRLVDRFMASRGTTATSRIRSVLFAEQTARQAPRFAVEGLLGRTPSVINEPSIQRTVDRIRRYEVRVYTFALYVGLELTQIFDEL